MRCLLFVAFGLLIVGCRPTAEAPPDAGARPPLSDITSPNAARPQYEDGFVSLLLEDFESFPEGQHEWDSDSTALTGTGAPKGYLYSREDFENFTWRADFRYLPATAPTADPEKFNTGFMLFIQEPHRVWPKSLEVQGRFDEICQVKGNGGAEVRLIADDDAARKRLRGEPGDWKSIEIVTRDGSVTARLNGEIVGQATSSELRRGRIGLQAEGFAVEFRNLRIRRDEP